MNFLKKGPELKLSEMKVPGFLEDVYYDLKDRHLLPVVAILVVALVAVPIMISQGSGEVELPPSELGGPEASISAFDAASGELVAKSAPGLREFNRRLDHLEAQDPFRQQAKKEDGGEAGGGAAGTGEGTASPGTGESGGSSGSEELPFPSTPSSPPSEPSDSDEDGVPDRLRYYSYAIDVRIVTGTAGEEGEKKTTVRRNLPELSMLPSRKTPAIVYMGSTQDGKKAVMTISSDVRSIFGDAKCVLGSDTCQLMTMEAGLPVTFVYGGANRTFKIELLKVHMVETDELNKAPLGEPKKGGKKQDRERPLANQSIAPPR